MASASDPAAATWREREFTIAPITFRATPEDAEAIRARMELAVNALLFPTEQNANDLFVAGAEAIVAVAEASRAAA